MTSVVVLATCVFPVYAFNFSTGLGFGHANMGFLKDAVGIGTSHDSIATAVLNSLSFELGYSFLPHWGAALVGVRTSLAEPGRPPEKTTAWCWGMEVEWKKRFSLRVLPISLLVRGGVFHSTVSGVVEGEAWSWGLEGLIGLEFFRWRGFTWEARGTFRCLPFQTLWTGREVLQPEAGPALDFSGLYFQIVVYQEG